MADPGIITEPRGGKKLSEEVAQLIDLQSGVRDVAQDILGRCSTPDARIQLDQAMADMTNAIEKLHLAQTILEDERL